MIAKFGWSLLRLAASEDAGPAIKANMFYDLNVPWTSDEAGLQRTIAFLDERTFEAFTETQTSHTSQLATMSSRCHTLCQESFRQTWCISYPLHRASELPRRLILSELCNTVHTPIYHTLQDTLTPPLHTRHLGSFAKPSPYIPR